MARLFWKKSTKFVSAIRRVKLVAVGCTGTRVGGGAKISPEGFSAVDSDSAGRTTREPTLALEAGARHAQGHRSYGGAASASVRSAGPAAPSPRRESSSCAPVLVQAGAP